MLSLNEIENKKIFKIKLFGDTSNSKGNYFYHFNNGKAIRGDSISTYAILVSEGDAFKGTDNVYKDIVTGNMIYALNHNFNQNYDSSRLIYETCYCADDYEKQLFLDYYYKVLEKHDGLQAIYRFIVNNSRRYENRVLHFYKMVNEYDSDIIHIYNNQWREIIDKINTMMTNYNEGSCDDSGLENFFDQYFELNNVVRLPRASVEDLSEIRRKSIRDYEECYDNGMSTAKFVLEQNEVPVSNNLKNKIYSKFSSLKPLTEEEKRRIAVQREQEAAKKRAEEEARRRAQEEARRREEEETSRREAKEKTIRELEEIKARHKELEKKEKREKIVKVSIFITIAAVLVEGGIYHLSKRRSNDGHDYYPEPTNTPNPTYRPSNYNYYPYNEVMTTVKINGRSDTLWAICKNYYGDGTYSYALAEYNNVEPKKLRVGMEIKLPYKDILDQMKRNKRR